MDLYTLLQEISGIVTPETNRFYEYALHTFDDNGGFLRTRYCWWDKCLENRNLKGRVYRIMLLSAKEPITEDSFVPIKNFEDTNAKMQLDYGNTNATFNAKDIDFDIENGYCYVYLIDLEKKTKQMKHFILDFSQNGCIREIEV
ncbi:MAG: hypothetical protein LIV11_02510 [Bacillota bacterium]|nr:hypothetical protein [Bacillota bacterium]